jgi:amidase
MPRTSSSQSLVSDVAACKQSDRQEKLQQFMAAEGHRPTPRDDVLNVQSYPQAALTEKQRVIVNLDATALVKCIQKSVYTSTETLMAFVTVAIRAQDVTNCLTESCLKEAFARAEELDQYLRQTGEVVGPLHGLPVSIKDHIKVKGLDTSSGYTGERTPNWFTGWLLIIYLRSLGL